MAESTPIPSTAGAPRWHVAQGGKPTGPFDDETMRLKVEQGELSPAQKVWRPGMEQWLPSRDVPEVQQWRQEVLAMPRWHVAVGGKPTGPYNDAQIEQKVVAGELDDRSKLWRKGQDGWKVLPHIEDLAELRERALRERATLMPPALDDDDDPPPVPPTISIDESIPTWRQPPVLSQEPVYARERETRPVSVAASASAPVVSAPSEVLRTVAPAKAPAQPMASLVEVPGLGVAVEKQRFALVDRACASVKALFSGQDHVTQAVERIQDLLRQHFVNGNPHGLDAGVRVLQQFIEQARARLPVGASRDVVDAAYNDLINAHRAGGDQVARSNPATFPGQRMVALMGVRPVTDMGLAPRA